MWWTLVPVALVVVVPLALVAFGAVSVRGQRRALAALRRHGAAFLCLPPHGQWGAGMWIVAADATGVTLSRAAGGRVRPAASLPAYGAVVRPATVQVNVARSAPGVEIVSPAGPSVLVALYPDPSMRPARPLAGGPLEAAAGRLAAALRGWMVRQTALNTTVKVRGEACRT